MTSSPGPTPETWSASCSAVVQFVVATASAAPTRSANAASNSRTRGPCETQPGGDHLGDGGALVAAQVRAG